MPTLLFGTFLVWIGYGGVRRFFRLLSGNSTGRSALNNPIVTTVMIVLGIVGCYIVF